MVFNFEEDFISDYNNNNLLIDLYWSNSNREQIKKLLTENQNETSMQLIETDIKGIK